jgi:peptidoglycan/LPS O-acetylase OafA/YrhL
MRGLMTLGVMGAHSGLYPKIFPGSMILMDMFFAMSGYLITSLLIKDVEKRGGIDFRKFYIRRFSRLSPALVAMLMLFVMASILFSTDLRPRIVEAIIGGLYISNYWVLAFHTPVPYTGHLWSLAVEEQFYLIWPVLFALLVSRYGLSKRTVTLILAGALLVAIIRVGLVLAGASVPQLGISFHTHADALLLGCATAVLLTRIQLQDYPLLCAILAWSLVPLFVFAVACMATLHPAMRWYYCISPFVGAIPGIIAVCALVQPRRTFMHRFYDTAALVFCGRICYGLYIWHIPILAYLHINYGRAVMVLLGWPIVFVVATASYFWIERPFMRARPI